MIKFPKYSWEFITSNISLESLVHKYVPGFRGFNKGFRLRSNDKLPSTRAWCKDGTIWIKDFGDVREALPLNQFLCSQFCMPESELCEMIIKDFNLSKTKRKSKVISIKRLNEKLLQNEVVRSKIDIKPRDWHKRDIEYWKQFNISIELLDKARVRPVEYFWITNHKCNNKIFRAASLSYSFDIGYEDGLFIRKIYQPMRDRMKWISNCGPDTIQNKHTLNNNTDLLVIQSSMKDALFMTSIGFNSVAPLSESSWFSDKKWGAIKGHYKEIVYFGNNDFLKKDNPGLWCVKKIEDKYGIRCVHMPNNTASDITDYCSLKGIEEASRLANELILGKPYVKPYECMTVVKQHGEYHEVKLPCEGITISEAVANLSTKYSVPLLKIPNFKPYNKEGIIGFIDNEGVS